MLRVMSPQKGFIRYRFDVLFLFVFFEVILYDKLPVAQAVISVIEYTFILASIIINRRVGVMYLISFTLLSMGAWSYVTQESLPYNFWGLRVFGFSANILFCIGISFYLLISNRFRVRLNKQNLASQFYIFFIVYSFLLGGVFTLASKNYYDNFIKDFLVYLPFFLYLFLISFLSAEDSKIILKYGIALSIIAMLISYFSGQLFDYGEGHTFVLMNSFSFSIIFPIYFFKDLFTKKHLYFFLASILFLLIQGKVFIGSKSIMLIIFLLLWIVTSSYRAFKYFLFVLLFLVILVQPLTSWISQNIDPDLVVSYKFNQIFSVFEIVDIDLIAFSNTSMGNIVAEAVTIIHWMDKNFFQFIIGKGFGGGLNDTNGYLATYVGPGAGYSEVDLARDQFTRFHLPLFEVIVKAGLLGTIIYLRALILLFKRRDIFSFSFFIILLSVFSNSKEMILLSLIFNHLAMSLTKPSEIAASHIIK